MAKASALDYIFDEAKYADYASTVKDFCMTNGLVSLKKSDNSDQLHNYVSPLAVTLFPTCIPANEFEYAINIQQYFNQLIYSISHDFDFLKKSLANVIQVDDFTRRLWNICEVVKSEGITQPISLAILRNDFMIDENKKGNKTQLSQIEINTISCSFGAATSQVSRLHRYMLNYTNNNSYIAKQAPNQNIDVLARNMVKAWELYGNAKAKVAFLVSVGEINIGDQRMLEYKCLEINNQLSIVRYSLTDVADHGYLNEHKRLMINDEEIGLVYFRCGYDPKDYFSEKEWSARLMIERSFAIKCPTIDVHLVGAKIIQQVLTEPNVIEMFVKDESICAQIRATFVEIHQINQNNLNDIIKLIMEKSDEFVLKPQREGGGNNIYKSDIIKFVETLHDKNELMGYILMKLVRPSSNQNVIVRIGSNLEKNPLISELGIFGVYIGKSDSLLVNETGGYLLRSKSYGVNEGGVASGYSALDSICFV